MALRYLPSGQEQVLEHPEDVNLSTLVAKSLLILRRQDEAIERLVACLRNQTDSDAIARLRHSLSSTYVSKAIELDRQANESAEQQAEILSLLQAAMHISPGNRKLIEFCVSRYLRETVSGRSSNSDLLETLVQGAPPGISHFVQGTLALHEGNSHLATTHLQLAALTVPNSPAVLNNLAVALSQSNPDDLELPLRLVNAAIESAPLTVPAFHETRGAILFRMQRYHGAVVDLEQALVESSLQRSAHSRLATCYQKLGDSRRAAAHSQAAARLESPSTVGRGAVPVVEEAQ